MDNWLLFPLDGISLKLIVEDRVVVVLFALFDLSHWLEGIKSIVWLFFAYACIELKNDYRQVSSFKVS